MTTAHALAWALIGAGGMTALFVLGRMLGQALRRIDAVNAALTARAADVDRLWHPLPRHARPARRRRHGH